MQPPTIRWLLLRSLLVSLVSAENKKTISPRTETPFLEGKSESVSEWDVEKFEDDNSLNVVRDPGISIEECHESKVVIFADDYLKEITDAIVEQIRTKFGKIYRFRVVRDDKLKHVCAYSKFRKEVDIIGMTQVTVTVTYIDRLEEIQSSCPGINTNDPKLNQTVDANLLHVKVLDGRPFVHFTNPRTNYIMELKLGQSDDKVHRKSRIDDITDLMFAIFGPIRSPRRPKPKGFLDDLDNLICEKPIILLPFFSVFAISICIIALLIIYLLKTKKKKAAFERTGEKSRLLSEKTNEDIQSIDDEIELLNCDDYQ